VSVRDTGIGIAAEQLPHIYQMFSQVDSSLERSQGGLGIGLTLVKRLVELHGGTIEARSEGPGKGSEFVVRLPVAVAAAGPQPGGGTAEPAAPKSSLRILVVDDHRDAAYSLAKLLRLMGNDTRTAYDGQEGVAVAAEFRPDVMLLDIGLPKLNGYEACRRIREQPWGKQVVLVAVTGWGQEDDRRRSREAEFDHHMVKPVDPDELMKLLAGFPQVSPSVAPGP
jgi:CheY-like chemotaxis protein